MVEVKRVIVLKTYIQNHQSRIVAHSVFVLLILLRLSEH